jgi:hypothetical protein
MQNQAARRSGIAIDRMIDLQPRENTHETSDDSRIAGRKLHRLEHYGSKRRRLRARRGSRGLRRRRRGCRRRTARRPSRCCCCSATEGRCSSQGVLIFLRPIRSQKTPPQLSAAHHCSRTWSDGAMMGRYDRGNDGEGAWKQMAIAMSRWRLRREGMATHLASEPDFTPITTG